MTAVAQDERSRWSVAAPFFVHGRERWLDDFLRDDSLEFRKVPASGETGPGWHNRRSRGTPVSRWRDIWKHAGRARDDSPEGIITIFPQLALMAGLQNRKRDRKLIAWCFNVGARPGGMQRRLARRAFRNVDRFVVHASGEIPVVADWFDIPPERIRFAHLQQTPLEIVCGEEEREPFIAAMGSANRDYPTFFDAIEGTGIPVRLLAAPRLLDGLRVPENVTVLPPTTMDGSRRLAQAARISVVPLNDTATASGQVTVVEAMRMNRPVVATRTVGTRDYIEDRETGMLADPKDSAGLRRAIVELWEDRALRARLAANAAAFADTYLSDEAAAASLHGTIRELRA